MESRSASFASAARAETSAPSPQVCDELAALLSVDTPAARSLLYLRLLYSPSQADALRWIVERQPHLLPEATADLLGTIDFERLAIEQMARVRNLRFELKSLAPEMFRWLGDGPDVEAVRAFCDAKDFWHPRGRTLLETFCLFVSARLPLSVAPEQCLIRLWGIVSGLPVGLTSPTPWANSVLELEPKAGIVVEESFRSPWPLVTPHGEISDLHLIRATPPGDREYRIGVALGPGGVTVSCGPLEGSS